MWKVRSGGDDEDDDDDDDEKDDSDCGDIKIWRIKDILCITVSESSVIPHQEWAVY